MRVARKKKVPNEIPKVSNAPKELNQFVDEATHVQVMTQSKGWEILKRDFELYKQQLLEKLPYYDPNTKEFLEGRITYIALHKLMQLVEDYKENKKEAMKLIDKLEHPETNIVMDVDNRVEAD